jgi:hypothetical protein
LDGFPTKERKNLLFLKKKKQKDFCFWGCFEIRAGWSNDRMSPPARGEPAG